MNWPRSKAFNTIPFVGVGIFVCLYVIAASLYPGGSQTDLSTVGFDWVHNYWCNLMNETAMNETTNPARPVAISAMIILCLSLLCFFVQFALIISKDGFWKNCILICGVLSMTSAIFIFTQWHDLMTTTSSVFGLFAVIGIIRDLFNSTLAFYKITGAFCLLLLGVNNYIYYTNHGIEGLPLLQKFTFAIVLFWIIRMNLKIRSYLPQ